MRLLHLVCPSSFGCRHLQEIGTSPAGQPYVFGTLIVLAFGVASTTVSAGSPVNVAPDGDNAVISTSIDSWSAFMKGVDQQKIEEAKGMLPEGMALPKDALLHSPVKAWSKIQINGISVVPEGESQAAELGAAFSIAPDLEFDVATSQSDDTSQHKFQNRAALMSKLQIKDWSLIPQAALVSEQTRERTGSATTETTTTRIDLAPEIRHHITLDDGSALEPFFGYKTSLGLTKSSEDFDETAIPADKVEIGITLTQPDQLKIEATTGVEGLKDEAQSTVNSRIKLTVPLD